MTPTQQRRRGVVVVGSRKVACSGFYTPKVAHFSEMGYFGWMCVWCTDFMENRRYPALWERPSAGLGKGQGGSASRPPLIPNGLNAGVG